MARTSVKTENTENIPDIYMKEVQKKIDEMLKAAEEKARMIIENAAGGKKDVLSEEVKAEIARNEEYVSVELFKDSEKYQDDVYIAVGNQNCVIQRGVPVKIKKKFYLALTQSSNQDMKTAKLIEREAKKGEELN